MHHPHHAIRYHIAHRYSHIQLDEYRFCQFCKRLRQKNALAIFAKYRFSITVQLSLNPNLQLHRVTLHLQRSRGG